MGSVMSNHPLLKIDMSQLSVAERIQLAEDLWDSILTEPDELPLTDAQIHEINWRLDQYQQTPTLGSSWEAVKGQLGL
jgi:putative addiction module component (TIGR02574 family)